MNFKRFILLVASVLLPLPHGTAAETHDLAVSAIVAPRRVVLTEQRPRALKPVLVFIQNRGSHAEVIPDAATLGGLVELEVRSLGSLASPASSIVVPRKFPITLAPNRRLAVVFRVSFDGAAATADASRAGYRYEATVRHDALDGTADSEPANNTWPLGTGPGSAAGAKTVVIFAGPPASRIAEEPAALAPPVETAGVAATGNCEIKKLTAKPMTVCMKKGAALSDPISIHSTRSGGRFTSFGGDLGVDPQYIGNDDVKCRYDMPGDYTVEGYCDGFGGPKSITVHVVRLMAEDGGDMPVKVGITTGTADRSKKVKFKIEPASQATNVEVKVTEGSSRLEIVGDPEKNGTTITVTVQGIGKEGSEMEGDAAIEATVSGAPADCKATQKFTVVRPYKIVEQSIGSRRDRNVGANSGTSPGDSNIPSSGGKVALRTFYGWDVIVHVRDRFGNTVGNLYKGSPVNELQSTNTFPINRNLLGTSAYVDPVGIQVPFPGGDLVTEKGNAHMTHLGAALAPAAKFKLQNVVPPGPQSAVSGPTSFRVQIDGFDLVSTVTRTIKLSPTGVLSLTASVTNPK